MAFRIIFLATGTPLYGPRLFFSEMIRPIDRSNFTYRWLRGFFVCTISRFSFPRMLLVPKKMRSFGYVSRPKKRLPPAPESRRVNPKHQREPKSHAYCVGSAPWLSSPAEVTYWFGRYLLTHI